MYKTGTVVMQWYSSIIKFYDPGGVSRGSRFFYLLNLRMEMRVEDLRNELVYNSFLLLDSITARLIIPENGLFIIQPQQEYKVLTTGILSLYFDRN